MKRNAFNFDTMEFIPFHDIEDVSLVYVITQEEMEKVRDFYGKSLDELTDELELDCFRVVKSSEDKLFVYHDVDQSVTHKFQLNRIKWIWVSLK